MEKVFAAVVAHDARNAFYSASRLLIDAALQRLGFSGYLVQFLRSYLSGQTLLVDVDGVPVRIELSCDVSQGSVIGPCLCKIFYDDLLQLEFQDEMRLVDFADDIALVISAPNADLREHWQSGTGTGQLIDARERFAGGAAEI